MQKKVIIRNKPQKKKQPPQPKRRIVINKSCAEEKRTPTVKAEQPANIPGRKPSAMNPTLKNRTAIRTYSSRPQRTKRKQNPLTGMLPIGVVAAIVIILIIVVPKLPIKPQQHRHHAEHEEESNPLSSRELAVIAMSDARIFENENAKNFDSLIAVFQKIVDDYPDTPSANTAQKEVVRYTNIKRQDVDLCKLKIEQDAELLIDRNKIEDAVSYLRNYDGPYASETEEMRLAHVKKIENDALKKEQEKPGIIGKALTKLFNNGISDTYLFMKMHENDSEILTKKDEWHQLKNVLDSAMNVPDAVRASFTKQIGQTVEVELKTGKMKIQISGVSNGKIQHYKRRGHANIIKELSIESLSDREWTKRLGKDLNGYALSKALEAVEQNKYMTAKSFLPLIPSPLHESLTTKIDELHSNYRDNLVTMQLAAALRRSDVKISSPNDFKTNLALLKETELSLDMRLMLHSVAKDVWQQNRKTKWIKRSDVGALVKYMIELKPAEEDLDPPAPETDFADYNSQMDEQAEGTNTNKTADTDRQGEAKQTDWRNEIDF
jgi:hypothetical protein